MPYVRKIKNFDTKKLISQCVDLKIRLEFKFKTKISTVPDYSFKEACR